VRLRHLPGRLPVEPGRRGPSRRPAGGRGRPRRPPRLARRGPPRRGSPRPPLRAEERPSLAAAERARRARQLGRGRARGPRGPAPPRRRGRRAPRGARPLGPGAAGGAMQLRFLERWISIVRLIALPFIVSAIAIADYPPGRWETWAWVTTAAFAI